MEDWGPPFVYFDDRKTDSAFALFYKTEYMSEYDGFS